MFDVPNSKRVRREELYDSTSDEDEQSDSTLRGKLNAQLSGLLDISFTADGDTEEKQTPKPRIEGTNQGSGDVDNAGRSDEEEFTFRLFKDEKPSRKVVLSPQDADIKKDGEGGFVVAKRPRSYYFAAEPSPEAAREFRTAAVSADYLLQDAKKRRWGLEKPWKVTTIVITTNKKMGVLGGSIHSNAATESGNPKKKRPGKKRRVILRVREKTKKEREEAAKNQLAEKEQLLKEKKQRSNRQKKLRKRAKQKEKQKGANDDANSEQSSRDSSPTQE